MPSLPKESFPVLQQLKLGDSHQPEECIVSEVMGYGIISADLFFFFFPLKAKVWISLKFSLLSPDTFLMLSILPAPCAFWTPLSMVLLWSEGLRVQGECHIALTAQTYLFHSLKTKEKDQTKMKG